MKQIFFAFLISVFCLGSVAWAETTDTFVYGGKVNFAAIDAQGRITTEVTINKGEKVEAVRLGQKKIQVLEQTDAEKGEGSAESTELSEMTKQQIVDRLFDGLIQELQG